MTSRPELAFAATNPCHMWDLARASFSEGASVAYYSGYPAWRLNPPPGLTFEARRWRTLVTYGLLRLPESLRPDSLSLFLWQDRGFDRAVARSLQPSGYIHGLPGQCLETFKRAKQLGVTTVLNHASGPVEQQLLMIRPEYERAGLPFSPDSRANRARRDQVARENDLADLHCAASTVVRDQLVRDGVEPGRIWVVPYGADTALFTKSLAPVPGFRICFAGQLSLRKGIFYLLRALEQVGRPEWSLDLYGPPSSETANDLSAYRGPTPLTPHGAVPQEALARAFASSSVLVLPSAEEAFGLVVVQALQCGVPCIVSDRVGAKDLIVHRGNGSVFPFGDSRALAEELLWWADHPRRVPEVHDWAPSARTLLRLSRERQGATSRSAAAD